MKNLDEIPPLELTPPVETFVLHWGEMGSRWGVSRTVAQIHALLLLAPRPLHAEEIAHILSLARSTVSTSLRDLQGWGVIRLVHVLGDRRDHFEAIDDVWEMFRLIVAERKKREIDPTLEILKESQRLSLESGAPSEVTGKLDSMLEFFEAIDSFYEKVDRLSTSNLQAIMKAGGDLGSRLLAGKDPESRA
jgi:DNA-binding transcriptional regulator GbsR (MarR family)